MKVHMNWRKAGVGSNGDPITLEVPTNHRLYCTGYRVDQPVPVTNDESKITCKSCHRKLKSITRDARISVWIHIGATTVESRLAER